MMKKIRMKLFILLVSTLLLVACSSYEIENRVDWEVGDFEAINQDGESVSLSDLKGEVWIADLIFTDCTTVCPLLTVNMAKLQQKMKAEGIDVKFVSFSVDPETDTPEILREYGENFAADYSNWHFLTGYKYEEINDLSFKSFKAPVQKNPDDNQIMHGTRFYLVDRNGKIAKHYPGNKNVQYEQIIKDAKSLVD